MSPLPSRLLNLGIVAHVDAGKTSLTERLLYDAGVIDAVGSVDDGTTRTDSMNLERRRGITIRAAVTSFPIDDIFVNLIDTPGHPDFIAEVERSLAVLDAAVLVLSSVEGVQPQSVVILRALRRIGVPTVVFVNKVDRAGADVDAVVAQVRRRLSDDVVVLSRARRAGSPSVGVERIELTDDEVVAAVAGTDDGVLRHWVEGDPIAATTIQDVLWRDVRRGRLTPVLCGSAITGVGVDELREVLRGVVPRHADGVAQTAGSVFAVDRDDRGRRAWLRLWSGELRVRDRVPTGAGRPVTVTEVGVSEAGGIRVRPRASAGQIVAVRGPMWRVGDVLGEPPARRTATFAPATLEALVEPADPARRTAMFAALTELADEDPLIALRLDAAAEQAAVRLHGEVQKEVIGALLAERYGIEVEFSDTTVVCIERVVGAGEAVEHIAAGDNPYLAGVGLRIEAREIGHGVSFDPGIEPGRLTPAFLAATEEGVRAALGQGPHGWAVTDCAVTMTDSGYHPRQSKMHQGFNKAVSSVAGDFRLLAPVVVFAALAQARTQVCEPVLRFELEVPDATYGNVVPLLGRLGATTLETSSVAGYTRIVGHLPAARLPALATRLPDLTSGEGLLTATFDHYAAVAGARPPTRRRRGADPADRLAWFRAMPR